MYENENSRHTSTCLRYANNQTEPHVLHKNGRRFNSTTLTKWINFNTRERFNSHHRNDNADRINQPNFGIQQRPGFFPSEVTYEFLYPKRCPPSTTHKSGKSSLAYCKDLHDEWNGRTSRDTNKHRRKIRRNDCLRFDLHEQDYDFEAEDIDDSEYIIISSDLMDENEKWSIVFEDTSDQFSASINFPIGYFIPSSLSNYQSTSFSDDTSSDIIHDHKAHKYFEPPPPSINKTDKPSIINEELLCSIPCQNESGFLTCMQQSTMKISQANLSPAIFLQGSSSSSFSVVYTYCRTSSKVNATLKFADPRPKLIFDKNQKTLEILIEYISNKLDESQINVLNKSPVNTRIDVDALRGSLPLPINISQNMLLVRPNSTDKQTALQIENINIHNAKQQEQWFDTTKDEYEMVECSVCCEILTVKDACQLLPCKYFYF